MGFKLFNIEFTLSALSTFRWFLKEKYPCKCLDISIGWLLITIDSTGCREKSFIDLRSFLGGKNG